MTKGKKIFVWVLLVIAVLSFCFSGVTLVFALRNRNDKAYTLDDLGVSEFLLEQNLTSLTCVRSHGGYVINEVSRTDFRDLQYVAAQLRKMKFVPTDAPRFERKLSAPGSGYTMLRISLHIGDDSFIIRKRVRDEVFIIDGRYYVGIGCVRFDELCEFVSDEARWGE